MSQPCIYCPRPGFWLLKLTFCQAKGRPRYGMTFETEGLACDYHKLARERLEKKPMGIFELIGAATMQEVATMFHLKGWGEPKWAETSLEWTDTREEKKEEAPTVKVKM